jgi:hypothetical protein
MSESPSPITPPPSEPIAAAAEALDPAVASRIRWRAAALWTAAGLAVLAVLAPWHAVADRQPLDRLGCMWLHGGCGPADSSPMTYTLDTGLSHGGALPALAMAVVATLAALATVAPARPLQLTAGVVATLLAAASGVWLVLAVALAHMLENVESRGGGEVFLLATLATFVLGIVNLVSPVPRARGPSPLPRAIVRAR